MEISDKHRRHAEKALVKANTETIELMKATNTLGFSHIEARLSVILDNINLALKLIETK